MVSRAAPDLTAAQAWALLDHVPDPELPMVSIVDLGIVRDIQVEQGGCKVTLTPTYSGCPATAAIAQEVRTRLQEAGAQRVVVDTRIAPPWSSDWMSAKGRQALRDHGIAPPGPAGIPQAPVQSQAQARAQPIHTEGLFAWRARGDVPACPRCGSADTRLLSRFGSTACKSLHVCQACREPFDHFKPH